MKKLLLTTALVALTGLSAYSQGVVAFINNTATRLSFSTNPGAIPQGDTAGAFLPTGTRFLIALYYAPDGPDPGEAGMLNVMGASVNPSPLAGRISGGNRTTPTTTAPGANAWFQVRTWESAFGSDYETAVLAAPRDMNGQVRRSVAGKSNRFNIQVGSSAIPGVITGANGLQPFASQIVPEPSTIALAVLGGLGTLVLLRRRK
jgi:hypothetical protein